MEDPIGASFEANLSTPSADERLEAELLAAGFHDTRRARAILHALSGQGVTDDDVAKLLPNLLEAAAKSPDPDRALNNLERWASRLTPRVTYFNALARSPSILAAFFYLTGVSQYFADLIIANPEYMDVLSDAIRGHSTNLHRSRQALQREVGNIVSAATGFYQRMDSLRRLKQREMLRIGIRDILSLADMPETAREFSQLADVCIHETTRLVVEHLNDSGSPVELKHFAVIGMGKLGGEELNYSSDVDLIFIYSDQVAEQKQEAAYLKLAEMLVDLLSKDTISGRLFRVDTRLRPEGRFGPIARSLAGSRAYYESWAESWERQSLLKARPVGGGRQLGNDFMRMIADFVYRLHISPRFLAEIQENKRRIEKRAAIRNETYSNIKTGFGGIRDIEFAVQILQLEYGGTHSRIRCANTLRAITCLQQASLISNTVARELIDDYIWLRTLEHRLQLLYDLQTQKLPANPDERWRLARRVNYPDLESFEADMDRRRRRVHEHSERIVFGADKKIVQPSNRLQDLVDTIDDEASCHELGIWLTSNGFRETNRAFQILRTAAIGTEYGLSRPDVKQRFLSLAPYLLEATARSPDPDNALLGIEELAQAVPNRAALYASLSDGRELMNRLIHLAASSPNSVKVLAHHLEWLELLVSEEMLEEGPKRRSEMLATVNRRSHGRVGTAFYDELARFLLREWLRISARDVWDEVSWQITATDLTSAAEGALQALLEQVITGLAPAYRGEAAASVA
ncbi:MAG: hypothetical protein M1330_03585, partial [Armatimonadetes bacterium]|nr:hypothetical protein [Armatimonadota bacterium]